VGLIKEVKLNEEAERLLRLESPTDKLTTNRSGKRL